MRQTDPKSLTPELIDSLHGDMVPKFLATQDASGRPNVVPIISLDAADDRTLIFGECFIWKTRANLQTDPRVCAAVVTGDLRAWAVRGRFREFVESGPYLEAMNAKPMFRYNAYVRISRAAVIDVQEVTGNWTFSRLGLAAGIMSVKAWARLVARRWNSPHGLPVRVAEKFARAQAVKVIAFPGTDGYPEILPAFSLVPAGGKTMVFGLRHSALRLRDLPVGTRMAASVITMDPIAYQVKGIFTGCRSTLAGRIGCIQVDEAYSAGPPLPGELIAIPS
jgi:hypothetical protein